MARGLSASTERPLRIRIDEQSILILVHASPYSMAVAIHEPSRINRRITTGVRRVNGSQLGALVLADETYQTALRTYGNDLDVVLASCVSIPHAARLSRTLGRPVWTTDGSPAAEAGSFGLEAADSIEPSWFRVEPDGTYWRGVTPPDQASGQRYPWLNAPAGSPLPEWSLSGVPTALVDGDSGQRLAGRVARVLGTAAAGRGTRQLGWV
jgi:hypothetical protein